MAGLADLRDFAADCCASLREACSNESLAEALPNSSHLMTADSFRSDFVSGH